MKIYRLSYSISQDDVLAARLSKEIFAVIKENMGKDVFKEIKIDRECDFFLYTHNNRADLIHDTFDIKAIFDYSKNKTFKPSIQMNINFSDKFPESSFDKMYYELFNAVKHELGHYCQYNNDELEESVLEKSSDYIESCKNLRDNILSNAELVPYIKGLVFASKKSKKSFAKLLDENLNGLFFYNDDAFRDKKEKSSEWSEINEIMLSIKREVMRVAIGLYSHIKNSTGDRI